MVMIFASLAPAVSHALVSFTGNPSFTQKICTTSGNPILIQVKTTLGQQLATELPVKGLPKQTAENHFEHCPFCLSHGANALLTSSHSNIEFTSFGKFYFQAEYTAPVLLALHLSDHPSRAPPAPI